MKRRPLTTPLSLANVANTVLCYLQPDASILDYGSGVGHKPAVLQCLGFNCCAVDNMQTALPDDSDRVVAFAGSFGVDYRRLEIGNELLPFAKESFDMTMMHHVIEHLHDSPRKLLNHLLELTKPGGYLYVAAPDAANVRKRIHLLQGKTNSPPFQDFYTINAVLKSFPLPPGGERIEKPRGDDCKPLHSPTDPSLSRFPRQEASSMDTPVEIVEFSDYL